jgi:uracil-DNA glycosylase
MMELESSWHEKLHVEFKQPYFRALSDFLEQEQRQGAVVYPPKPLIFQAFSHTPFDRVKVVIMGQDPYHGDGQANGLSFSVPCGMPLPPSLRNIFQELEADLGISRPQEGCLTAWARQGVLLLNATLTVRRKEPGSHQRKGWEEFTDAVIRALVQRQKPVIFVLWGKYAQAKCAQVVPHAHHVVLTAPHPSPYSAHTGFLGCRHFSQINKMLLQSGQEPIDWSLS